MLHRESTAKGERLQTELPIQCSGAVAEANHGVARSIYVERKRGYSDSDEHSPHERRRCRMRIHGGDRHQSTHRCRSSTPSSLTHAPGHESRSERSHCGYSREHRLCATEPVQVGVTEVCAALRSWASIPGLPSIQIPPALLARMDGHIRRSLATQNGGWDLSNTMLASSPDRMPVGVPLNEVGRPPPPEPRLASHP